MRLFKRKSRRKRMSPFKAGAIGIVLLAIFLYFGFTKFANPFSSPFTIHAVVPNAGGLRPDSLVRIAGVNVGTVTSITPIAGKQAANVTMTIQSNGLPIHRDATFWIRPRTFLEGNFFVDLYPGSPTTPDVRSGYTFPIQQTRYPVQLDQLFSSLQANTRKNLQTLLTSYGSAVKRAGPSFNASINYWLPAYEYTSVVTHDLLGEQPHDLSSWIAKQAIVSGAFDAHPQNLENLITDFNTTANAFARENVALERTVAELPHTLRVAIPAFNALNAAFPPLRALARTLLPGVKTAGPAIEVSLPFIHQLRLLVRPSELEGLSEDLSHTIPSLAKLTQETIPLMRNQVRPASSCVANVIIPWSKLEIHDPHFNASNGFPPHPAYLEVVQLLPGLAGESRNFDANGPYIRLLGNGGTFTYSLQPGLFGSALSQIEGVQPIPPANDRRPPLKEHVPCETQPAIKTLNAPTGLPPAPKKTRATPASQALSKSLTKLFNYELDQEFKLQHQNLRVAGTHYPPSAGGQR
jgi:phospholipid/cholesterol/gamma-HCH transport system substrate-binding protein